MYEGLNYNFKRVCNDFGRKLIEKGGQKDHVHLLVELEKYYRKGGLWSPSYFIASCGGAPLYIVKEYVEKQ